MFNALKSLLFHNEGAKQTIVKNIFWLSFGQIASRLIRAAIIIYSARILGAAEYGVFSYALGLAGFFTIFADIGINSILTREVAKKPDKEKEYFATAFVMKVVLLIGTALLVLFVAPHFSKIGGALPLFPLVALLVIFDNFREFSFSFFRAKEKMELEAFVFIGMNIVITIFGFVVLSFVQTSMAIMVAYMASSGVAAFATAIILRKYLAGVIKNFVVKLVREIGSAALPIALLGLLGAFMLNTDMIMLGWWRTAEEIGFYSSAQKIVQVLYTLPAILAGAIFPAISRLVGLAEKEKERALMEKSMSIVFLMAIPLTVGGMVLAKSIIQFLYGGEYAPAAGVLQILIMTTLFAFPGALIGNLVLAHNKQNKMAAPVFFSSVTNIIFNAVFIPPFGIIGAAVATIFAQLISVGLMWRIIISTSPFSVLKYLKKIIISAFFMGIAGFILNMLGVQVLVTIFVSSLVYLVSLILLKEKLIGEGLNLVYAFRKKIPESQINSN